ncbi:MAG: SDR family NAD(P)-dependent oxidoreductase [Muribaculaceae bacterium]|nr:SDR family NAD(P)-dependent oxidoreductase [Muribaculaceae bacterium]
MSNKIVAKKSMRAVVTGASSGIGLEFCRRLAEMGHNLVMVSNQESELIRYGAEISQKHGVEVSTYALDLTEENAASKLLYFLSSHNLVADILINNAGIFSFNEVLETPMQKINLFTDLHIKSMTELCWHFGREMRSRGGGYILNMSSMSCWMPMPGIAMYSATKAYIRVFSRALHYELKDSGVSVTVACPGGIATDLFGLPTHLKKLAVRLGVLDTAESFTRKAVKQMFRRRQQYINGWLNRFSIFFIGVMPTSVRMLVKHKMLDKNIRKP